MPNISTAAARRCSRTSRRSPPRPPYSDRPPPQRPLRSATPRAVRPRLRLVAPGYGPPAAPADDKADRPSLLHPGRPGSTHKRPGPPARAQPLFTAEDPLSHGAARFDVLFVAARQEKARGQSAKRKRPPSPLSPGQTLKLAAAARQLSRAGHFSSSPPTPQHAPAPSDSCTAACRQHR